MARTGRATARSAGDRLGAGKDVILAALIAAEINRTPISCREFAAQAARPVALVINRLPVDRIAFDAMLMSRDHAWSTRHYRVGRLIYQGSGFPFRSRDARFPAIRAAILDQTRTICRYGGELPSGYDPATGQDSRTGRITPTLLAGAAPPKRPPEAAAAGARPTLARHVPIASDPVYRAGRQLLLALMRPTGRGSSTATLIVASGLATGVMPAVVIARLRGAYRAISAVPNPHGTDIGVGVVGVGEGGQLREVSLRLPGDVVDALMAQVGSPMR